MSKRSRKRKKQKPKRKGAFSKHAFSGLGSHVREGTKLRSPFSRMEKMALSSWRDDHMPEMLWAALLSEVFSRNDYLGCFRVILNTCAPWFEKKDDSDLAEVPDIPEPKDKPEAFNYTSILDHTKLAELTDEQFRTFIKIPLAHPLGYAALRPLLHLSSLPGINRWKAELAAEPTSDDWETLGIAVASVLDHQSERSTDIRWFKLMLPSLAGLAHYPSSMKERIEELTKYPNRGDMRSVRPFIRSGEMMFRRNPPMTWIENFWAEVQEKTQCIDPTDLSEYDSRVRPSLIRATNLYACRDAVISRFTENISSKRVDPRLDGAFGFVLYGLSIVEEVASRSVQHGITGRLGLRAVVEANITLRYLVKKDSPEVWSSYRVFGAGQAKLAFLKAQEAELPSFLDEAAVHEIANEDVWQEFIDIDVGHWAKSNLRGLAEEIGAKETYDKYYGWSSTYTHSHWGAIRDTNFITCHNPLHRLHRIPRLLHRELPTVEKDFCELVSEMIGLLDILYPSSSPLPKLEMQVEPEKPKDQTKDADSR